MEWIKTVAKSSCIDHLRKIIICICHLDLGQLQTFIQIANQTMESDLIRQLLQDLLKFGSTFAPLIYDVSLDENCEMLIDRCKSLWKFIDEDPNLRKIAVSLSMLKFISNAHFCRNLVMQI